MDFRYRIACISKGNRNDPHTRIAAVGCHFSQAGSWMETPAEVARMIAARTHSFYVLVHGVEVDVIYQPAQGLAGEPYIQTVADGAGRNLLLSLPDFPQDYRYATLPRPLPARFVGSAFGQGVQRPI